MASSARAGSVGQLRVTRSAQVRLSVNTYQAAAGLAIDGLPTEASVAQHLRETAGEILPAGR